MNRTTEMFWAFVCALVLSSYLATIAYLLPGTDAARTHMFELSSSMVTGALGFFAGRASTRGDGPPPPFPSLPDGDTKR